MATQSKDRASLFDRLKVSMVGHLFIPNASDLFFRTKFRCTTDQLRLPTNRPDGPLGRRNLQLMELWLVHEQAEHMLDADELDFYARDPSAYDSSRRAGTSPVVQ
jgi:hypothetical protein